MSSGNSTTTHLALLGKRGYGLVSMVDVDTYFWAKNFAWFVTAQGYVATRTGVRTIILHRILMDNPKGLDVDHINGDKLNNTRANLRAVSRRDNIRNNKPRRNCQSKYKGVTYQAKAGKWIARIVVDGEQFYLGIFAIEEDAAKAYDAAAVVNFKDHAWLNFPRESHDEQSGPQSEAAKVR